MHRNKSQSQVCLLLGIFHSLSPPNRVNNGPLICLPSPNQIKHHTKYHTPSKDQTTPIHCHRRHHRSSRPETKEQRDSCVDQSNYVDDWPEDRSHVPRAPVYIIFDGIIAKTLVEEERDGNHVGNEEGGYVDGHDRVEGCGRADVYQGEEERDYGADEDRVEGESCAGVYLFMLTAFIA